MMEHHTHVKLLLRKIDRYEVEVEALMDRVAEKDREIERLRARIEELERVAPAPTLCITEADTFAGPRSQDLSSIIAINLEEKNTEIEQLRARVAKVEKWCIDNHVCTRCGKQYTRRCRCHLGTKYDGMTCIDACKNMQGGSCFRGSQKPRDYVGNCEDLEPKDATVPCLHCGHPCSSHNEHGCFSDRDGFPCSCGDFIRGGQ